VLWNEDPKDFACASAEELLRQKRESSWQAGDIILLHDNVPHAAAALPQVIVETRKRGLEFATVGKWIGL
jgi:peptidoglycan/xylan/chitin deacetylase (PgdA/CDA1 family)